MPLAWPRNYRVSGEEMRLALRRGEVLLALGHDDGLALDEVAHRDLALLHARQRAVTAVVGQPLGAADRRRREAADRAEVAGALAPEMAHGALLGVARQLRVRVL